MVCSIPPSMCSLLCFSFYRALCPNISLPLTLLTPSVPSSVFPNSPLECASAYPYILDAKHATLTIMSSCPMRRTASLPAPVGWGLNSSVSRFHPYRVLPLEGLALLGTQAPPHSPISSTKTKYGDKSRLSAMPYANGYI